MPATKPIFDGVVKVHNTLPLYVGVFKISIQPDGESTPSEKWFWMRTDSSGVLLLDRRLNKLGDFHTSKANALLNIPTDYRDVLAVDNYISTKEIGFLDMFPWDVSNILGKYDAAIVEGATYIVIPIWWDRIFRSLTEQDANDASKWADVDTLVNYVKAKSNTSGTPMKVSLRIFVAKDDGPHNDIEGSYNPTGNFYGLSQSAMDEYGKPVREITDTGGTGNVSFAYTTGRNQVLSFIEKALIRYKVILGSQFFEYSVVYSPQQEAGNTYDNQFFIDGNATPRYAADFDHSTYSVEGFRTWLASSAKYNGSILALNSAWGTAYSYFYEIQSPKTGVPYNQVNRSQVNAKFSNRKGLDWWYWNNKLVVDFMTDCRQLGITNITGAKFVVEYASLFDDLAPSRSTCDVKNIRNYADKVKAQLGALPSFGDKYRDLSFSLDIFRENIGNVKFGTELNHNDFVEGYEKTTDPTKIESMMVEMGQSCIKTGANDLLFISNGNHLPYFNAVLRAMNSLKSFMFTNNFKDAPTTTVNFSLEQFLINRNQVINNFIAAGGSATNRIKTVQVDGTPPPSENCANAYVIYSLQRFCLSSNSIKSNGVSEDISSSSLVRVLFPTHSITNGTGTLSKCNVKITGVSDSITYIKNTQSEGYRRVDGELLTNNHPDRRYEPYPENDARFYLPVQQYDVEIENTGSVACNFDVDALDINEYHDSQNLCHIKVPAGTTKVKRFDISAITYNSIRQFKINCNRYVGTGDDTDGLPTT